MTDQDIYLSKITEALARVNACETYLSDNEVKASLVHCESAALQMRKAMEAIAFASIAPNKEQYVVLRSAADNNQNFREDWNARTIFQVLAKVNPDFYPKPMGARIRTGPTSWHYCEPEKGHMSQKTFERFYRRLGKFLHADNPWGNDKGWSSLANELAGAVSSIRKLLVVHRAVIRTPHFSGVWVVEAPKDVPPQIFAGHAQGEFIDMTAVAK